MRGGLTRRMLLASGLLALLVGAAFAVLLLAIGELRDSARLARHSAEVLATAQKLERLVIDLQTGQRGYVIAGEERFLEPWRSARSEFPKEATHLENLVADNAEQEARAQAIAEQGDSYLREYSVPLVETARADLGRARKIVASGEGKRRVDAIRSLFTEFTAAEEALGATRDRHADSAAGRAVAAAVGGLAGSLLLILLFAGYLTRAIVTPVGRVATAASRLAAGDLSTRVPEGGSAEVGELGRTFNVMAGSLQESRDELESQNAELELQTAELEDQQAQLASANEELEAQQAELAGALGGLEEEKRRVDAFYGFGEQLASETELESLTPLVLRALADFAEAEVGALYVTDEGGDVMGLACSRGLDGGRLPAELRPGEGLAGRSLAEQRPVVASYGEATLTVAAFGEEIPIRHELHLPLLRGDRAIGVVTLARLSDRPFAPGELEAVEHLADQATVGLANALTFEDALRQASINKVVIDSTTDAIVLIDLEGSIVLANKAADHMAELHGVRAEGSLADLAVQIRDRTTDPEAYWAEREARAADPDRISTTEYELVASGRSFKTYTAPVRDSEGSPIGRIITVREVTMEREAERLKTELVATVSHELRTPLASVLGFAELLSEREVDAETQKRYVSTIHNEARRLTDLINDFLDLQRIEEGRFTLSVESFELGELLAEEVALFSAQSTKHELFLERPAEALTVAGEPDRIRQVVANLLSNAIKYSPAGGLVRVAADQPDGQVRVRIADSGFGIPADQQRQIFEKFFRVDTSDTRAIGGTGLGLALCREIVERHGGRIGFESAEGEGSTFWFELPAGDRMGRDGYGSILLIEDDPGVVTLLSAVAASEGYGVEVSASGEEGLARAEKSPPVLICLDIGLAGELDGWEVLGLLKTNPATAHVPVLVCTAGNGRNRAAALGAADFLTKPFSPQRLRETIARLVPGKAGSILVVDDEPGIRRLVAESVAEDGFHVLEAANGVEALAMVAERIPDAIVLDLMMPELDGFSVLERLQADPETRVIPVVVLTAKRLSGEERNVLQAGAVALLEKSDYSAEELRRLIRQATGAADLSSAVGGV